MIVPFAIWRPVGNHSGPMSAHLGLIDHVQQGMGSLAGYFDNRSVSASSTWWVAKNGTLEQYVDAVLVAWAQAAGNGTYTSIESEGFDYEPDTPAQVATKARLYAWGHVNLAWPFQLAEQPGQGGFGWHGMGGSAWGGHFGCPGNLRKAQRGEILRVAQGVSPAGIPAPQPVPQGHAPDGNPFTLLAVDGNFATQTVRATQWKLHVPADGAWGPVSRRALQSHLGVGADGVVGPVTVKALQAHVGAAVDGNWGPETTKALQTALNAGRF